MSTTTPANTIDLRVGYRLRTRREELGISRRALARMVGLSPQQLIKFERGINSMVASQLAEFSILLNVSPTYFFGVGTRRHRMRAVDRAAREVQTLLRSYYQIRQLPLRLKIRDLVRTLGA